MAGRAGRKPKAGDRYPSGQRKEPVQAHRYERVAPTPELEGKKREVLGELASCAELDDAVAILHRRAPQRVTKEMWQAAGQHRGRYIRAFGRLDEKPGALAGLLPDARGPYRVDEEAQKEYFFCCAYVTRHSSRAHERALYALTVKRKTPADVLKAIEALELLTESQNELAKRREREFAKEMQAAAVGLAG